MRESIMRLIEEQTEKARDGEPASITCKTNSLTDPQIIELLYKASQAGVRIDLIVRSICCLRPGVEAVSENIRVVSLVGRFLEHARIFAFSAGLTRRGTRSADLMQLNLERRVEGRPSRCARSATARKSEACSISSSPTRERLEPAPTAPSNPAPKGARNR